MHPAAGIGVFLIALLFGFFSYLDSISPVPAGEPLVAAVASSSVATSPVPEAANQEISETAYEWYSIVRVVDGDTVVVRKDGADIKIRLIGLDTPEVVDPRKPVQCFGKEASDKAKSLLTSVRVRLEHDPSQGMLDTYGRTLAYLFLTDGTHFNRYMIAEGYGHEYTYRLPYRYQSDFQAAEKDARGAKKGLWADGACASTDVAP